MGTISARVPDDLEEDLEEYVDEEQLDRSTAIRKLLSESLAEWRINHALEKLDAGEMTFSRAAEIADVDPWRLATLAEERGITWVGGEHLEDDLEEF
ncbi:hypothetical protein [Halospeciosus flavus]|uniref:Uncharacterized protein n=1 Tax=Halospeciosus flavus TaxID=3032283 RepID=A0ABD5Z3N9_9EURY|nr:hypothetical protein [Halospeciosus flavus]